MRKLLSLSLGLLTAASALATVKNITIPAVPDGNKRCGFVVKEIPTNLGLTDDQHKAIEEELVGWTWGAYSAMADNMVYSLSNGGNNIIHGATFIDSLSSNDTINVVISAGKMPELHIQDTVVCASENLHAISLPTYKNGTVWIKNFITGEYQEVESPICSYFASEWLSIEPDIIIYNKDSLFQYFDHNLNRELSVQPIDTIVWKKYVYLLGDPILDTPSAPKMYMFTMSDTVTGCHANMSALISVQDCSESVMWINYDGPKEYNEYRSSDYLSYLKEDSIMALDPRVNCICPLTLDTIVESTQSDDATACEHYKYDVTVKLAANSDTIVAYVLHLNDSGSGFAFSSHNILANNTKTCTFTVPDGLAYARLPDCDCGSYYYSTNMNIGDTITSSCDLIYTFKNFCTGDLHDTIHIIVPNKDEVVQLYAMDTTVYASDSTSITQTIESTGTIYMYDWYNHSDIQAVPNNAIHITIYKDSINPNNIVMSNDPIACRHETPFKFILDNSKKSGTYYYVARDTITGCTATAKNEIIVLDSTNDVRLLPADLNEVKANVYSINGGVVMQNVYLKDAMSSLKEGLYIFNNKKIFIRRKE